MSLSTNRNSNLNDVSWHPRGETAFITGDLGVALRYTTDNHAISTLNGSGALLGVDMTSVEWRPAGDYTYFWRFRWRYLGSFQRFRDDGIGWNKNFTN